MKKFEITLKVEGNTKEMAREELIRKVASNDYTIETVYVKKENKKVEDDEEMNIDFSDMESIMTYLYEKFDSYDLDESLPEKEKIDISEKRFREIADKIVAKAEKTKGYISSLVIKEFLYKFIDNMTNAARVYFNVNEDKEEEKVEHDCANCEQRFDCEDSPYSDLDDEDFEDNDMDFTVKEEEPMYDVVSDLQAVIQRRFPKLNLPTFTDVEYRDIFMHNKPIGKDSVEFYRILNDCLSTKTNSELVNRFFNDLLDENVVIELTGYEFLAQLSKENGKYRFSIINQETGRELYYLEDERYDVMIVAIDLVAYLQGVLFNEYPLTKQTAHSLFMIIFSASFK